MIAPASALASYRQTYQFVHTWGYPTPLPSPGFQPLGISIDSTGNLFVAGNNDYVSEYTSAGVLVSGLLGQSATNVWGTNGLGTTKNVAVHGDDMWVVDYNDGLAKFDTFGAYSGISKGGIPVGSSAAFAEPAAVAIDASGCVYVSDHGSDNAGPTRISKFGPDGAYVTTFGDTGDSYHRVWDTRSIAIGPHFQVYVADWGSGTVRVFMPNAARTIYTAAAAWMSSGWDSPTAVAVDRTGNVFVLDDGWSTITKLDSSGHALAHWGGTNAISDHGKFQTAFSIAVAPNGRVFVSDRDGATVQQFKLLDLGPTTAAYANLSVKKGKTTWFKYKVNEDISNTVKPTIRVYRGGVLKATIGCGTVSQGVWHTKSWTCKLARGSYVWKVYATDMAGHKQRNVAWKTLTVK